MHTHGPHSATLRGRPSLPVTIPVAGLGTVLAPPPPTQSSFDDHPAEEHQLLFPYGVGIDTHSRFIQVCIFYQQGATLLRTESTYDTTWTDITRAHEAVCQFLEGKGLLPVRGELRYCIESTGTYHFPILRAWRGIPTVVNPLLAGPTRRKTDVLDARMLANYSITGLWKSSFVPTQQAQELRVLWAARAEQQRFATRAANRINNIVLRFGHTFGREASMRHETSQAILEDLIEGNTPLAPSVCPDGMPASIRPILQQLMHDMQTGIIKTRKAMAEANNFIKARDWPSGSKTLPGEELLALLQSVPGIGATTAVTWLAEVTDPSRFPSAEQVAAYCGCDPSLKVSAGKVTSHVRRAGNTRLHRALLMAATGLLRRTDCQLANWGRSIAGRHKKGGFRKAAGALARRLAVGLWIVHTKLEKFSDAGYNFSLRRLVPTVALNEIVPAKAVLLLGTNGIKTSQALSNAFFDGKLAPINGLGDKSLETIKAWVVKHARTATSSPVQPEKQKRKSKDYALAPDKAFIPKEGTTQKEVLRRDIARLRTKGATWPE